MREDNGVYVLDVYVGTARLSREECGFSQARNSLASSPVRPFDKRTRKGTSVGRSSLGVLGEEQPVANDQMESDSDERSERENFSGVKAKMTKRSVMRSARQVQMRK